MLTIELVPRTSFYKNLRSELPKELWDKLRRKTYRNANYKCEICGGVGKTHPVEVHEIWGYDDKNHIQKLKGLVALCPMCHKVKHIGLTIIQGRFDEAELHIRTVNNWTRKQTIDYINEQFAIWKKRSQYVWDIDISWLNLK